MNKKEPKIILNLSFENNELEEKVKIAMDKYAEQLVVKNLDDTIEKIVENRIEKLLSASHWSDERKINGVTLEEFVKSKTEGVISEFIDKNAKEILAKRLAEILTSKN